MEYAHKRSNLLMLGLVPSLVWVLSAKIAEGKVCGDSMLNNESHDSGSSVSSVVSSVEKVFERIDRLYYENELATIPETFSGEGYCAYRVTTLEKEPTQEIIKPAYLLKKEEKLILLVGNSYDSFSEYPLICEKRVEQLREAAEQALRGGQISFSRQANEYVASSADPSWTLNQQIKSSSRGLILKANADNPSWRGKINCHFLNK